MQHEGLVASLDADGLAEILITPGTPGIPGAPEVSTKVCHCATDASNVTIRAVNLAKAEVGDLVRISRKLGVLWKNAAMIIGIPVLGGGIGLMAGLMVGGVSGIIGLSVLGLVCGIAVGASAYKRFSRANQFVVSRVITRRSDMATCPVEASKAATETCAECIRGNL
ncbi:MAG: SoxR reducing system RseC family protein [Deltaproteobacteria bacterium]|nr:SoxR reducing system RseC family protein [Deltaproteobacteria bacterium]